MARLTFAPFSRNSALRASVARSSPEGPRRPSRTGRWYLGARQGVERPASTCAFPVPMFRVAVASAPANLTKNGNLDVGRASTPTFMAAATAGALIASKEGSAAAGAPLTVADAAAKTGLALRDAGSGLKWLSTEYRGRLRVTAEGELVH